LDINFQIKEENSKYTYEFGKSIGLIPDTTETKNIPFIPDYFLQESDSSTVFEIKAFINTDAFDRKTNDTVISYQRFSDYYAYDDGSAEYGYGLGGQNIIDDMVAYEFDTKVETDSLQAVDILFNRVLTLTYDTSRIFNLMVWADNNGQPGDSISGMVSAKPDTNKEGQYQRFFLKKPILLPKTFYIGWQQTNLVYLNIGLDRNRSSMDKIQINLNDGLGWQFSKSYTSGALMMRPMVGSRQVHTNVSNVSNEKLKVYPNPATDFVKIEIPNELAGSKKIIQFYDITGKVALTCQSSDQNINIGSLNKGLYLIRIQGCSGQVFNARLVKN
jgi:hypothetical protein